MPFSWSRTTLVLGCCGISIWSSVAAFAEEAPIQPAARAQLPPGLVALPVPGFNPAVFVAPAESRPGPWPITVVLHGNYDRPEWECDIWSKTARARGWLLCPRGQPRTDAPPGADRWTYKNRALVALELEAAVTALEQRFPGRVTREQAWLIGFSLGANMTPRLLLQKVLPFTAVTFGEGGFGVTVPLARSAAARGVSRVVYLCGERTYCPTRARQLVKVWHQGRIPGVEVVIMPGVGHWYADEFEPFGRRVFELMGN